MVLAFSTAAWCQPAIDPQQLRQHLKTLSSDSMEGRGSGQAGGEKACRYLEREFQRYGLQTTLQEVPLVGLSSLSDTRLEIDGEVLRNGQDVVVNNQTQQELEEFEAPLVFVGFGIEAPAYQWDDYKGQDLKGKVALLFVNEPSQDFEGKALTYFGRWTYKFEETARRGALATLIIHRTDLAAYDWDVVRNSGSGEKCYLPREKTPALAAASWISWDFAQKLVSKEGYQLENLLQQSNRRDFTPIPLKARLRARVHSQLRRFHSYNLLARLGKAPEAVMYSAHYDHLGIHPQENGDNIYNGAVDNASGCAVLLELARVYAGQTGLPRSLLFLATTAEEQGLLGAAYFARHPLWDLGRISLDLNFDMVPPWGIPEEVTAVGSERTTFAETVAEVAAAMKLRLCPEAHPEAGLYFRMDHFSLARQGVPAFSVGEGTQFRGHPRSWGEKLGLDYVAHHYHHPSDEFQESWDFAGLARFTQFAYQLGRRAILQKQRVDWRPDQEFHR